jgi:hypothetical protein
MRHFARRGSQQGIAAIEMALLIIPLLLFVLVGVEAGRALTYYNALAKGTRDGARYLSMHAPGTGEDAARCLVVYGNVACTGNPVVPGLDTSMVKVNKSPSVPMCTSPSDCYGTLDLVQVQVHGYTFRSFMLPFFPGSVTGIAYADLGTTMRQAVS